jgi:hypothetical protein
MALGWKNPLPLKLGGGRTETELVYEFLRRARGRGPGGKQAIGPADGLRDLKLRCEAIAIAKAAAAMEHALMQAFPSKTSSAIEVWENLLGVPAVGELEDRRRAVWLAYTREIDATTRGIRDGLQRIDAAFDVDFVPPELAIIAQAGREFGPLPGTAGPPFGSGVFATRLSTAWPNYADFYVLRARYVMPAGQTEIPIQIRAAAEDYLNDVLPGWMDFTIYNVASDGSTLGFYFDGGPNGDSLMDQTAMT